MSEETELLKQRTMRFALDVCALIKHLPHDEPGPTVKRQLAKAATGVAFIAAAARGRGSINEGPPALVGLRRSFVKLIPLKELDRLTHEARELLAIISASAGTARYKERNRRA